MHRLLWLARLAAAAVLLSGTAAQAALLSYEGFDYGSAQSLAQADGGFGWAGPWTGHTSHAALDDGAGLSYTDAAGNALLTTGRAARLQPPGREIERRFDRVHDQGVLWLSYLYQPLHQYDDPDFDAGDLSHRMTLGKDDPHRFQLGAGFGRSSQYRFIHYPTDFSAVDNTLRLFVIRFDFGTGQGDASTHLWVDPRLDAEPDLQSAVWALTGLNTSVLAFDTIRFRATHQPAPPGQPLLAIDEIRLATTFASVVPEPGSLALLGAGLALIPARRRKQA